MSNCANKKSSIPSCPIMFQTDRAIMCIPRSSKLIKRRISEGVLKRKGKAFF